MTWLVIRNQAGSALVEHHALIDATDIVLSRHETITEARQALVAYRERANREAAIAAGQGSLFND